ncbi:MAG: ABC transporter substrate-binding protein [Legionellales bacterium]|nr:ABC transporter substrate-binding protein [Legionellales bacterium]
MSFRVFADSKSLTVLLDWYLNPDHAPLFVAQQYGFFKQQGLDVKLLSPTDPGDPLKLLAAGRADIAISYQPSLLIAANAGIPVVRIGTLIAMPLNSVAVLKSSSIQSVADLRGKKIAYSVDGLDHALLDTMLASAGLTEKDVTLINAHYGLTQALMSGKVDAVTGIMRNFEPFEMADNGHPARLFNYEDYGVPLYDELILLSRKDELTDPRLPAFLAALTQAANYLINHPEETWQAFAKAHPELNNELNRQAWFASIPRFALRPAALDVSRYEHFAEYFQAHGVIKTVSSVESYAVELRY